VDLNPYNKVLSPEIAIDRKIIEYLFYFHLSCLQAVEKLLEDSTQLQKSSVLGIVLRRVFLQFDKLSFRQPT
jgi:hypothetical protein